MRTSSATQLELPIQEGPLESDNLGRDSSGTFESLRAPNPSVQGEAFAIAARRAGRLNASSVSDKEWEDLLRQRSLLLDKQFSNTITRQEKNRLEYIRWSLDRIEDARNGESLDRLEDYVTRYEQFLTEMKGFESHLLAQARKPK